jgi:hypothetical protein
MRNVSPILDKGLCMCMCLHVCVRALCVCGCGCAYMCISKGFFLYVLEIKIVKFKIRKRV